MIKVKLVSYTHFHLHQHRIIVYIWAYSEVFKKRLKQEVLVWVGITVCIKIVFSYMHTELIHSTKIREISPKPTVNEISES